jgi:hypothetical protein
MNFTDFMNRLKQGKIADAFFRYRAAH